MRDDKQEYRRCVWWGENFPRRRTVYCSTDCRNLASSIQAGLFPVRRYPRCGRLDLRIESAKWASNGYRQSIPWLRSVACRSRQSVLSGS